MLVFSVSKKSLLSSSLNKKKLNESEVPQANRNLLVKGKKNALKDTE